jgi:hypothetical protein
VITLKDLSLFLKDGLLKEHLLGYHLTEDYQKHPKNSESMIYIAMFSMMLKRLD